MRKLKRLADNSEISGADRKLVAFWLVLTGWPIPLAIAASFQSPGPDNLAILLMASVPLLIVSIFLARFKARFTPNRFVFRRWGRSTNVRYIDIVELEFPQDPATGQPVGTAWIVTRDGQRHPFWPRIFPRLAVERFRKLAPRPGATHTPEL